MFEASRLGRLGEPLAREAAACSGRVRVKHLGSCRSRWRGKCGASAAARCELAADRRSRVSPPRRARPRHDDVRRWLANGRIIAGPDAWVPASLRYPRRVIGGSCGRRPSRELLSEQWQ
jgi:hypothetical protein